MPKTLKQYADEQLGEFFEDWRNEKSAEFDALLGGFQQQFDRALNSLDEIPDSDLPHPGKKSESPKPSPSKEFVSPPIEFYENGDWDWSIADGKILLNDLSIDCIGMNGYPVRRPYKHGEPGGRYLDQIARATGDPANMKIEKDSFPGFNTRRILGSPRWADDINAQAEVLTYCRNAMMLGDQVIIGCYGMSFFGGTDFPERNAPDGPQGVEQDDENFEEIALRCIKFALFVAALRKKCPNVNLNILNEYRGKDAVHWATMNTIVIDAYRNAGADGLIYCDVWNWATRGVPDTSKKADGSWQDPYMAVHYPNMLDMIVSDPLMFIESVAKSDPLKKTAFAWHLYADGGSYNVLNPANLEYLPGYKEALDAGYCVGLGEVGCAVSGGLNTDGGAGSTLPYLKRWGELYNRETAAFRFAWQTLNDHNSAFGKIKVVKTSKGGSWAGGSWDEVADGKEPFAINGVGEAYRDHLLKP